MEPRSAAADVPADVPGQPPRQRWRLVLARAADAPRIGGRDLADAFETAVEATGLPLHRPAGRARPRVALGAPLPLGVAAERELAELFLIERLPIWRVREALTGRLPDGWSLVDLSDVWVGGPPLAGRVVAADYRVDLADGPDRSSIAAAARHLLVAVTLPRTRLKGETSVAYDLRPLLAAVDVIDSGPPIVIRFRTRFHPELGTGRPEEVVAALGERLGLGLQIQSIVRECLILSEDPD